MKNEAKIGGDDESLLLKILRSNELDDRDKISGIIG
jgi:hypothetical protein